MKKTVLKVCAAVMIASAFVGCSKKNGTNNSAGGEKVKLELYYYKQENDEGLKNIVKKFESENPNISIDMLIIPNDADAQMSARAEQGDLPDILQMQSYSRVTEYASKGYLKDLSKEDCMKNVLPSSLPAGSYNGKQYALPMDYAGIGIIYNKEIFKSVGIDAPETFEDLADVCDALKEAGYVPFAGLLKENWSVGHFITLVHTALLSEKGIEPASFIDSMNKGKASYGDIDTDKLFKIMDFYKNNMNKNASEMGGNEQQQSFAKGEAAMMVQGLWSYIDAKKFNANLDAGFVPFPVFEDASKNKFYADVDSTFGISSQASPEKQAAAVKFLNWLSSDEGKNLWVSEYKLTHSFRDGEFSSLGTPYADLMNSVAEKGSYCWAFSQYPSEVFEDACKNGAQKYMMNKANSSDVIKGIDERWALVAGNK